MPSANAIQADLLSRLPDYLEILRQMVEINSFTANAAGVNQLGQLTAGFFQPLGFRSEFIPSVNPDYGQHLFLHRQAANRQLSEAPASIVMVSHLDTVFSPEEEAQNRFSWQPDGDRLYGPGTVDIKGGTVMMLMVLEALQRWSPEVFESTSWLLALDASEEALSEDFVQQLKQRLAERTRACLVFEGGTPAGLQDDKPVFPLVTARKGRASFRVRVEGRSAHAGNYHAQGANAIVQLAHTIQQIAAITDYSRRLTVNVGTVRGGSVINRVPHLAEADVEMRVFSPEVFQEAFERISAVHGSSNISSRDGFPCRVSVFPLSQTAPWPRNPGTDALFQYWQATASTLGMQVTAEERGGLSDGNLLWQSVPTLDGLGPSGANAHCSERTEDGSKDQEYALAPSFVPKAMINILSILRLITHPE